jgi:hypothetical protein
MRNTLKLSILFSLCIIKGIYSQNTPQTIVDDMTLPPDAALHGVPLYYSWASGAANGSNQVPAKNVNGDWFRAMTNWGQVYIPFQGSQALNTRCQIRNVISQLLMKDGKWYTVQNGNPQGAAFIEDFENNASINAGMRDESGNGGGISVIVGVGPWQGYNFHYWSTGMRAIVDVDSVVGVFTTCEARLIVNDTSLIDDRVICKNILQMGADWWLNQTIGWLPDWSANAGIGSGRTKWVTTDWQSFNYCSLLPTEILSNPPLIPNAVPGYQIVRNELVIYPNPAKNFEFSIKFKHSSSGINMRIYNLIGEFLTEFELYPDEIIKLNRELFKAGVYIAKISATDLSETRLIIVE